MAETDSPEIINEYIKLESLTESLKKNKAYFILIFLLASSILLHRFINNNLTIILMLSFLSILIFYVAFKYFKF